MASSLFVAWSGKARADDDPPPPGIEIDARLAYAKPYGRVTNTYGDSMDQTASGAIPIWLDLAWRPSWFWSVGAYASFAPTFAAGALRDAMGVDWGGQIRAGVEATLHLAPARRLDPWLAVGTGYESLRFRNGSTFGVEGWEILCAQGGVDVSTHGAFRVGPMIAATFAQYESSLGTAPPLSPKSFHGWFFIGVRGVFAPEATRDREPDPDEDELPRRGAE